MGHDLKNVREPDAHSVAKRLARPGKPCALEMLGLMDCMKRNAAGDPDGACVRERTALARCAAQQGAKGQAAGGVGRKELLRHLQNLMASMKRYGH